MTVVQTRTCDFILSRINAVAVVPTTLGRRKEALLITLAPLECLRLLVQPVNYYLKPELVWYLIFPWEIICTFISNSVSLHNTLVVYIDQHKFKRCFKPIRVSKYTRSKIDSRSNIVYSL